MKEGLSGYDVQQAADLVATRKICKDLRSLSRCGCPGCGVKGSEMRNDWFFKSRPFRPGLDNPPPQNPPRKFKPPPPTGY